MFKVTAAAAAVHAADRGRARRTRSRFRGKTNQGRAASLVTGADGVPTRVRVVLARALQAARAIRATGGTRFAAPFTRSARTSCSDTDKSYRVTLKGGLRGRISDRSRRQPLRRPVGRDARRARAVRPQGQA